MAHIRRIKNVLVAGASGQIGRALTRRLVECGYKVRAMIHRTAIDAPAVQCVRGDVSDGAFVRRAVQGMDAVCQLATTKEDPQTFLDVSLRGTYNLLEAARQAGTVRRFVLAGGDAAMGIYYYPQSGPINEMMPHRAYPGVYALSKVLEEVLGQQYLIQYGVPYVCLRCSWVMHKDMILRHLSARQVRGRLTPAQKKSLRGGKDKVVILVHPDGRPLVRHVVGLDDVVAAFLLALENPNATGQTFHIAAPSPFAYDVAGEYLAAKIGLPTVRVPVPEAHDFTIDISKARSVLGYNPSCDIFRIIDAALAYRGPTKS